eukprot:507905_1
MTNLLSTSNQTWCAIDIQYMILSSVMVLFTLYIAYKYVTVHPIKQQDRKDKALQLMAITISISLCLSYSFWIIEISLGSYCADKQSYNSARDFHLRTKTSYLIMDILNYTFYGISSMSFYAYLFYRLCFTFIYSSFRVNRKYKLFHQFVILLIPVWFGVLVYDFLYKNHMTFYLIFVIIGLIVIICGFFSLILSFNKNLFSSLLSTKTILESTQKMPVYTSLKARTNQEYVTVNLIAKHAILSTIMLSIGMIFVVIVCVLNFKTLTRKSSAWIIFKWFQAFSMLFNLLCVYLSWDCNDGQYRKMCGLCHGKIVNMNNIWVDKTEFSQCKSFLQSSKTSIDTYAATHVSNNENS